MAISTCITAFNMFISSSKGLPAYVIAAPLIGRAVPLSRLGIMLRASDKSSRGGTIYKYVDVLGWMGVGGVILFLAIGIFACFQKNGNDPPLWGKILLLCAGGIFVLVFGLYALVCFNFRVILDEEQLIYRNMWGITRRYRYEDIYRVKCWRRKGSSMTEEYIICVGRQKIKVNIFMVNFYNFAEMMKSRLRKVKNEARFDIKQY